MSQDIISTWIDLAGDTSLPSLVALKANAEKLNKIKRLTLTRHEFEVIERRIKYMWVQGIKLTLPSHMILHIDQINNFSPSCRPRILNKIVIKMITLN